MLSNTPSTTKKAESLIESLMYTEVRPIQKAALGQSNNGLPKFTFFTCIYIYVYLIIPSATDELLKLSNKYVCIYHHLIQQSKAKYYW